MYPNKKVLNSKHNSPWLLCPSKRFPGKFYYFNGSTGETAWSLNEAENKFLKNRIQTVTDRTHSYPEPFGSPADESTNTSSSSIRKSAFVTRTNLTKATNYPKTNLDVPQFCKRSTFGLNKSNVTNFNYANNYRTNFSDGVNLSHNSTIIARENNTYPPPSPMFGQAVFPKYVSSEVCVPKMIWALTPMILPEHKRTSDQITQYEPQDTFQSFQTSNRCVNPFQFSQFSSSTPLQKKHVQIFDQMVHPNVNTDHKNVHVFDPKPQTREEACQTFEPKAKRAHTQTESSTPVKPAKFNRAVETSTASFGTERSTLCSQNKDKNSLDVTEDMPKKFNILDKSDLRYLLVAKKNKPNSHELKTTDNPKSTKPGTTTPKKRVTFNLVEEEISSTEEVNENDAQNPDHLECGMEQTGNTQLQSTWYLAVDTPILLEQFDYIEKFVLADKNCRLLLPYNVYSDVETLSKGDCCGRQSIFVARQIVRKLATSPPHIVVQSKLDSVSLSDEEAILESCWQLLQEDCYVVLVTNNKKLTSEAKSVGIECHTLDTLKEYGTPKPVDPFDIKKPIKITVSNNKSNDNLFQQKLSEINPFELSHTVFSTQGVKKNLFSERTTVDTNFNSNSNERNTNDVDCIEKEISRIDITDRYLEEIKPNNQTVKDHNEGNDKDCAVSGIVKLNSVFNLDAELKRFQIKTEVMESRLNKRKDEWICRLLQIMEEVLTFILLNDNCKFKKILPPWSLYEAAQLVWVKFKNQTNVKATVEALSKHLFSVSSNTGKLDKNMKSTDLIKLIGLSMVLVENLKETLDFIELEEAKTQISEMINDIEDPETDINMTLDKVITPIKSKAEVTEKPRIVFRKEQSDILDYLKRHFPHMESYELEQKNKIVRTNGKDLNTVKIDKTKQLSVENTHVKPKDVEPVEPKITRNFNIIKSFEEKLKKSAEDDLDHLDYEVTVSTVSGGDEGDDFGEQERCLKEKEASESANDLTASVNETISTDLNNECAYAYSLVKSFLSELRRTFLLIYNFIKETMQDYKKGSLSNGKKVDVDIKINMAHKYTLKIIDRLNSITQREKGKGPTLRDLLIQAGDYSEKDETVTKYKEVIYKYLEQAEILEEALKIMLSLTSYKDRDSISTNDKSYSGTFATTVITDQSESVTNKMAVQLTN